ncbi:MAG: hypothetical protein KDB80_13390 [Planctomycetes bacterium]|nr:hypothetical protein [Planctomycetota bacterium]
MGDLGEAYRRRMDEARKRVREWTPEPRLVEVGRVERIGDGVAKVIRAVA